MGKILVNESSLSGIAVAIRQKNGESTTYKPGEMAAAIAAIPTGGSAVIESKSITTNGTYTAPTGVDGYSPVVVAVPNSYSSEDEGKVVSNGVLVAQTSLAVSANGTYDTTNKNSVVVEVPTSGFAFVNVTNHTGAIVTVTDGTTTLTGDTSEKQVFLLPNAGTWTIAAGGESSIVIVTTKGTAISVMVSELQIVPWSSGTDEQIAAIVRALDAGDITVADTGWQIGDERTVSLAAMTATGVDESHAAQSVTMVLMDSQHFDLTTATAGGDTKDHFVVGLKHSLVERGYMNSSSTNTGSWDGSARRTWCNNVFRAAIPATLRDCFKQFKCITAETYNGSATKISNDYFALFAEMEVFGTRTHSNSTEAAALSQIEWYKTAANRIKNAGSSVRSWWERSPGSYDSSYFCYVYNSGDAYASGADNTSGVAPFGCI